MFAMDSNAIAQSVQLIFKYTHYPTKNTHPHMITYSLQLFFTMKPKHIDYIFHNSPTQDLTFRDFAHHARACVNPFHQLSLSVLCVCAFFGLLTWLQCFILHKLCWHLVQLYTFLPAPLVVVVNLFYIYIYLFFLIHFYFVLLLSLFILWVHRACTFKPNHNLHI